MAYDLVLGGAGFVGSELVRALTADGSQVISVDRVAGKTDLTRVATLRNLDLFTCSDGELDELVGGCRVVYHLVWSSILASAESSLVKDITDNLALTARVFKAAARVSARVIFSSSGGTVYGHAQATEIDEDHPCRPISAYGTGKLAAETYADFFRRSYGLDVRIARLANPYGVKPNSDRLQGAVSRFALQAIRGEVIEIWGDGGIVRDYLHVSDTANCLALLGGAEREQLAGHHVFNVGSGHGVTLNEVLVIVGAVLGRRLDVRYLPGRSIDTSRNVLSIARAQQVLNWKPRFSLEFGVRAMMAELQAQQASLPH